MELSAHKVRDFGPRVDSARAGDVLERARAHRVRKSTRPITAAALQTDARRGGALLALDARRFEVTKIARSMVRHALGATTRTQTARRESKVPSPFTSVAEITPSSFVGPDRSNETSADVSAPREVPELCDP